MRKVLNLCLWYPRGMIECSVVIDDLFQEVVYGAKRTWVVKIGGAGGGDKYGAYHSASISFPVADQYQVLKTLAQFNSEAERCWPGMNVCVPSRSREWRLKRFQTPGVSS